MKKSFDVTGMSCSACSSRIQNKLNSSRGIIKADVNLLTASMQVEFDEKIISAEEIIKIVEDLGYGAREKGKATEKKAKAKNDEEEGLKKRFIYSILFLIPLMYVSMGAMFGFWLPPFLIGRENAVSYALIQLLLALPILIINRKFWRNGFSSLFRLSPNMDSLIAVGSAASLLYGVFELFKMSYGLGHGNLDIVERYYHDLYFETSAMIPTLITLGKFFEAKSKGKTSEALKRILDLSPKTAIVIRDNEEKSIDISELKIGDIAVVKSGMSIPCDGEVTEGNASVDESMLTGESIPIEKTVGTRVAAATINKNGYIKVKACRIGEETSFSEIVRLIEEASAKKAPIAKLADKVAGVFVPIVMAIALLTFIIWLIMGADFETAFSFGICVLVISCPCALGLATPVAIMVGTGKGAENGILIKSGEILELMYKANTIVFDKTGTITKGAPSVTDVLGAGTELYSVAYALEGKSEHPISMAITEYLSGKSFEKIEVSDFRNIPGAGIEAKTESSSYMAISGKYAAEQGFDISKFSENYKTLSAQGKTVIYIIKDKKAIGIFAVADEIKADAKFALSQLKKLGIKTIMLTGDNEYAAEYIATQTEIDEVYSNVLPKDKEVKISELKSKGNIVAMVGDGINDAPALAAADIGIAIGNGTDVAIESADVIVMGDGITGIPNAVRLSKSVIKNIRENLFWAFFYNVIGIPIAAGVLYELSGVRLSPMLGAAAMSFSSVTVVCNALRLRRVKMLKYVKEEIKMKKVKIEGMMCMHCVAHVKEAFEKEGITANVVLEEKCAYVDEGIQDEKIEAIVKGAGYNYLGTE